MIKETYQPMQIYQLCMPTFTEAWNDLFVHLLICFYVPDTAKLIKWSECVHEICGTVWLVYFLSFCQFSNDTRKQTFAHAENNL